MVTIIESDIAGGDNDYADLASWETATDNDLVSDDERHIAHLFLANSPYDVAAFQLFGGATTDATRYREITCEPGNKHDGTKGTGARIRETNAAHYAVKIGENFFRVTDIEIDGNSTGSSNIYVSGDQDNLLIDGCVVYSSTYRAVEVDTDPGDSNTIITVRNCLCFNNAGGVVHGYAGDADQYLCEYVTGVRVQTDGDVAKTGFRYCKCTNTACFHYGSTGGHADYLNLDGGSSNYASHDASGDIANLTASDQFVDLTDNDMDLHLKAGSDLEAAGTPIGGVTEDIDGDTRDGTNPDVGGDEYVTAGVTASLVARGAPTGRLTVPVMVSTASAARGFGRVALLGGVQAGAALAGRGQVDAKQSAGVTVGGELAVRGKSEAALTASVIVGAEATFACGGAVTVSRVGAGVAVSSALAPRAATQAVGLVAVAVGSTVAVSGTLAVVSMVSPLGAAGPFSFTRGLVEAIVFGAGLTEPLVFTEGQSEAIVLQKGTAES